MHLSLDFALLGFLSFATSLGLQILIWRLTPPSRQVGWLLLLFFALPLIGTIALVITEPQTFPLLLAPALLHSVLAANYIAIYPAFQASSPTVEILYRLDQAPKGLSEADLARHLGKALVQDRLADLTKAGLIHQSSGTVSAKGVLLAKFFMHYRKLVGLPEGVG